jgi:bifunctional non-homologous end joining protein LigD
MELPKIAKIPGAKKGILPVFVEPSLAGTDDEPPTGAQWIHEIKYDGYRIQARLDGGKVKLLTRKGLDWTSRFRVIEAEIAELAVGSALLDGEVVVQDKNGLSSFSGLQMDLKAGRKDRLAYFVFDLIYLEGVDLRGVALETRKDLLQKIISHQPMRRIQYSDHMDGNGPEIYRHACQMGLEGIVSKRLDAPYRSGRGSHWLKSKCADDEEFAVIGFVPSAASDQAIGSLVLGAYEGGKLIHVGRAGTGFTEALAWELFRKLEPLATKKPQFSAPLQAEAGRDVIWVKPQLVAQVQFRGWTHDRLLRQAAFKGLREDKEPADVVLDRGIVKSHRERTVDLSQFRLTHPDRIYWKDEGITKKDLAAFYADIGDWILPYVTGRVLSLLRCPSGDLKKCFYAKHAWQGMDDSLKRVDVGEGEPMLAIDDLKGLVALVQAGTLEIHPWGSRVNDLERPDQFIIDLDPGPGVSWSEVIDAAVEVRERLKRKKLKSFVKNSGGKGLHVVTPIVPGPDWDTVKEFTKALAEEMAGDTPGRYVAKMTKSLRRRRIFVDYLRNGRGATAVGAYSTRARAGAPVSTPLDWDELSPAIGPAHFTVENLRQRLAFLKRDPWTGFFKLKQKLP